MASLNLAELVNAFQSTEGRLNNLWSWFGAGNFAVVAAVISIADKGPFSFWVLPPVILGYGLFAYGNNKLIADELNFLEAIRKSLCSFVGDGIDNSPIDVLVRRKHPKTLKLAIHGLVSACVCFIVIYVFLYGAGDCC